MSLCLIGVLVEKVGAGVMINSMQILFKGLQWEWNNKLLLKGHPMIILMTTQLR